MPSVAVFFLGSGIDFIQKIFFLKNPKPGNSTKDCTDRDNVDGNEIEVCGEAPAPAAPEPVTPEGGEPRAGKKFVFGNAAEELELAVAQLRRAEGVPSVPEAAPAGEDKL